MGAFTVVLDHPTSDAGSVRIYTPGQTVSGKVIYRTSPPQEKLEDVTVVFKGKCNTQITTRSNKKSHRHREQVDLFRLSQQLFRGPYTMQPQTLEWPFTFTFPSESNFNRSNESSGAFLTNGPTPLPPTFTTETHSHRRGKAHIQYVLKVKVNQGRILHSDEKEIGLSLAQVASSPPPDPFLVRHVFPFQSWSSRQLRTEKHTFGQKMRHAFTSDPSLETPSIRFTSSFYMPTTLTPWQTTPLSISLQHILAGQTSPVKPILVLQMVRMELQALTMLRVGPRLFGSLEDNGKETVGIANFTGLSMPIPLDGSPLTLSSNFRLVDMQQHAQGIVSAFRSYTVIHTHRIKVTASVTHKDTGHLFPLEVKVPIQILAPDAPPTYQAYQAPPLIRSSTDSASPPPSYRKN